MNMHGINSNQNNHIRRLRPTSIATGAVRAVARFTLIVLPLTHLVLSPVHVGALLKLENEISGFLMFLSILFGLVVLFQATRMKADEPISELLCILGVLVVIGLTFALLSIYSDALRFQKPLNSPETIGKAVALCTIVCSIYALGALALVVDLLAAGKRKRPAHG
jgi:hypothetical protein